MVNLKAVAVVAMALFAVVPAAAAPVKTLILGDYSLAADTAILADLTATDARFDHDLSGAYDLSAGLPTATFLAGFDSVLLFTDSISVNLTDLSDLLGHYVVGGGGVVISTFWGQQGGDAGGLLNSSGFNPLINPQHDAYSAQTLGVFNVADPLFANVTTLSSPAFNGDYLPGLDVGATLAGSWASGLPLAAYSASHKVAAVTLNPNVDNLHSATGDYRVLFANALVFTAGAAVNGAVPEPATWGLMVVGFGAIGVGLRRQPARTAVPARA